MRNGFRFDTTKRLWVIDKTPDSTLDYGHDWTQWLRDEVITASAWVITPSTGLATQAAVFSDTLSTIFLAGGALGRTYKVRNTISTATRTVSREFLIIMKEAISG